MFAGCCVPSEAGRSENCGGSSSRKRPLTLARCLIDVKGFTTLINVLNPILGKGGGGSSLQSACRARATNSKREGGGGRGKGKKGHAARDCGRWNLSSSSPALFFFSNLALTCRFGSLTKIEGRIQRRACGAKEHMKP